MLGGYSSLGIFGRMMIGLILILLWIPAIFFSELNNKGNKKELKTLKKQLENNFLKTGKIVNNTYKGAMLGFPIELKNSIGGNIQKREYQKFKKKISDSNGNTTYKTYYAWSKPINSDSKFNDFKIKFNDNTEISVNSDNIDTKDLSNLLEPSYQNDTTIDSTIFWLPTTNSFIQSREKNYKFNNYNNFKLGDKKYTIYKIPTDKKITVFAKDDSLKKNDGDTVKLFYKGKKTKEDILNDKKVSNKTQKWILRIGAFLALFIGLSLIATPLKEVLQGTTNIFNLPILNILKPFVNAISGVVIFLWETFSFLGALVLTAILTFIVYFLVNYTVVAGIGLGVVLVILLIPQFLNR